MQATSIRELNCEFLYCLPTGNFFADVESKIAFFDLVASDRTNPILNLIGPPTYGDSAHIVDYQADRGAVGVITSLDLDRPLYSLPMKAAVSIETEKLSASAEMFTLSENGTICLCYKIVSEVAIDAEDAVEQLAEIRLKIKSALRTDFSTAVALVEEKMGFRIFRGVSVTDALIRKWVKSFEIIDFDFKCGRRFGHTILRDYYSGKTTSLPSDLTGFIRMTRHGVWNNYKPSFQRDFWAQNLGNRSDEIWLVHIKHFFRFHPERKSRESVKEFYDEVSLIIKKLVHMVAHINFLTETMSDFRLTESADWRSVLKFTDNLSEQAPQLPEYSKHDFLSRLVVNILEEFNFDVTTRNFHTQLDEIKASTLSYTSLLSAKRVNQLTVVVLAVTALQLAMSSAAKNFWLRIKSDFSSVVNWIFEMLLTIIPLRPVWWAIGFSVLLYLLIKVGAFKRIRYRVWLRWALMGMRKRK